MLQLKLRVKSCLRNVTSFFFESVAVPLLKKNKKKKKYFLCGIEVVARTVAMVNELIRNVYLHWGRNSVNFGMSTSSG